MSLWVDAKYVSILGSRLRNFKRKGEYLWNFSDPICGDSSKNKTKARGYIYKAKTGLFVKCHNCGYGSSLGNLIKTVDPTLHQEYVLENYRENGLAKTPRTPELPIPEILSQPTPDLTLLTLKSLDKMDQSHPAVQYVLKRKIPAEFLSILYFAPRFKKFVNSVVPNKFRNLDNDHPRLIIPFFDKLNKCFAFQGRAFGKEDPKYITIKIDDHAEKIYGIERLDQTKPSYIVEGPLDSLFISNCIAVSGSSFNSPTINELKDNCTIVYDNEPRSETLVKLIEKTIDQGYKVCLWPDTIIEKDINDMVKAGLTSEQVQGIIENNTYHGMEAKLRFSKWRKC